MSLLDFIPDILGIKTMLTKLVRLLIVLGLILVGILLFTSGWAKTIAGWIWEGLKAIWRGIVWLFTIPNRWFD